MSDTKLTQTTETGGSESTQSKKSIAANEERFNALMDEPAQQQAQTGQTSNLMDMVRDMHANRTPPGIASPEALVAQTKELVSRIQEVKETLGSPEVQNRGANLSPDMQTRLNDKLSHIDESLRIALSKVGIESDPTAAAAGPQRANPIKHFLNLLTDGQGALDRLGGELSTMAANNKEISPASMLAIQVKMGQVTQQIELFTSLLSKGLESIKTIMNVQV